MSEKAEKVKKPRVGLVIPKPEPKTYKIFRWSIPSDLAAAIELAASKNEIDSIQVACHILRKGLRVELDEVKSKGKVKSEG